MFWNQELNHKMGIWQKEVRSLECALGRNAGGPWYFLSPLLLPGCFKVLRVALSCLSVLPCHRPKIKGIGNKGFFIETVSSNEPSLLKSDNLGCFVIAKES